MDGRIRIGDARKRTALSAFIAGSMLCGCLSGSAFADTVKAEVRKADAPKVANRLVEKKAAPLEWLFPTGDETCHEGMAFTLTHRL